MRNNSWKKGLFLYNHELMYYNIIPGNYDIVHKGLTNNENKKVTLTNGTSDSYIFRMDTVVVANALVWTIVKSILIPSTFNVIQEDSSRARSNSCNDHST